MSHRGQAGGLIWGSENELSFFAYKENETSDICQVTYCSPTSLSFSTRQGTAWTNALRDVTVAQICTILTWLWPLQALHSLQGKTCTPGEELIPPSVLKFSLGNLSLFISGRSHLRGPWVSVTAFILKPPTRWDENHFENCVSVLKLSAIKTVNALCRYQFLLAAYPKCCSPTFFAPHCVSIVSLHPNLNVKVSCLASLQHEAWVIHTISCIYKYTYG